MKFLNALPMHLKLGILIVVTLLGLSGTGFVAAYLMKQQMLQMRSEEVRTIVEVAQNLAAGFRKEVETGELTKESAIAEFGRRARTMTFDNGAGYLFVHAMDGTIITMPDPKLTGARTSALPSGGAEIARQLREGVARDGSVTLRYAYLKPGTQTAVSKLSYAAAVPGWNMLVGTGTYLDDLELKLRPLQFAIGGAVLAIAALASAVAWMISRSITTPLARLEARMKSLAGGNLDDEIPERNRADEIGHMARTVEVFREALTTKRMTEEAAARESNAKIERAHRVEHISREFEGSISQLVESLSSSSQELQATANLLAVAAEAAEQTSGDAADASQEVSMNVQSVANATEEISSSVHEIARQVQEASRIAGAAVAEAEKTDTCIAELSQASYRIGDVVKLISEVAEQTSLLAVNAAIEASHAGPAGRGFAVVASEVKILAARTGKATGEIGAQIAAIQSVTEQSIAMIRETRAKIDLISEISSGIAAAIEQQTTATDEIARNVQYAAQRSSTVASNIMNVRRGAGEIGTTSSQVLASAELLTSERSRLEVEVERFLSSMRAA